VLSCMKISVTGHPAAGIHSCEAFTHWHLLSSTNRIPSTTKLQRRILEGRQPVDSWAICICPLDSMISHAETRIAIALGGFAAQNLLREFTPELLKATRKWHTPFPRIPLPEWWVKLPAH
jgi:uracil-DNA glycosylase